MRRGLVFLQVIWLVLLGACGFVPDSSSSSEPEAAAPGQLPAPAASVAAPAGPTRTPLPAPARPPAEAPFEDLAAMFDYNSAAPLDIDGADYGAEVYDIAYDSPMGGKVTAYLVVPLGEGPFAGMVFMHGGPGNRRDFLSEAMLLAQMGAVSVVIDGLEARPMPWHQEGTIYEPRRRRAMDTQVIIDLRRAVDVLVARPDVDPERIGFIGHSYGATQGGTLSGVEHRIKAYVLVASYPRFQDVYASQGVSDWYIEEMSVLDPIRYVGHAAPAALFFQYGELDKSMPQELVHEYVGLASEPKVVRWYDTGHMISGEMYVDHLNWLAQQLQLDNTVLK